MYKYRVGQHLTVLSLYSVQANKNQVAEFMEVKVSKNLNCKNVNKVKSTT